MRPLITIAGATAAVAALVAAVLLPGSGGDPPSAATAGPLLGADDRAALATPPPLTVAEVGPATAAARAGSAGAQADSRDPAAVATAYLTVAYAAVPADAQRPHRRAAPWAEPGSVPERVGVVVLDPPPPGTVREARVTAIEIVDADPADTRRLYAATVVTTTAGLEATEYIDVLVVRMPDDRWLVRSAVPATATSADDRSSRGEQ